MKEKKLTRDTYNNSFRLLSLKEEGRLSSDELTKYYTDLREYIAHRKTTNTTPGATFWGPKLKKITTRIAIAVTKLFSHKNVDWVCDGTENIPKETCIFAHSHQGVLDGFAWMPYIKRHCLILISAEVSKLMLLCQSNTGLIMVKKGDRRSGTNAKLDMINLLMNGHSIVYFPEGAWNLSPNKLHLPLSYGFLDIARKANVPVVPVVHEYGYAVNDQTGKIEKIHTRYGKPIYITPEDNIHDKLEEYEDQISTMRFDLISERGVYHRTDINSFDYINFLKMSYKHLQIGKIDPQKEKSALFNAKDEHFLFQHINDVPFDENGNFLDTEETIRINKIIEREIPMSRYRR